MQKITSMHKKRFVKISLFFVFVFLFMGVRQVNTPPRAHKPGNQTTSYVVQGRDVDSIIQAVESVGGIITHELRIINSVGAKLTREQVEELRANGIVSQLFADSPLKIALTDKGVKDEFNTRAFDNNDGIENWSDAWIEIGENDGATSGMVQVTDRSYDGPQCASGNCLRLGGNQGGTYGAYREVNLQGAATAMLTFNWRREEYGGYLANDDITVDISRDGGNSWDLVHVILAGDGQTTQQQAEFDISAYASVNTTVRFTTGNAGWINGFVFIDNIEVTYATDSLLPSGDDGNRTGLTEETVEDSFESQGYENNNGSVNWASAWIEVGEKDGPFVGSVQVTNRSYDEPQCASGDCLRIGGQTRGPFGAARAIDLNDASSAYLNFKWRRDAYEGYFSDNKPLEVQISANGGDSWHTLLRIETGQFDHVQQDAWFDITAFASVDTQIRFITGKTKRQSGFVYFDDIVVGYTKGDIPGTTINELIDANALHASEVIGTEVTIALLDSGSWSHPGLTRSPNGKPRVLAQYDAITDQLVGSLDNPIDMDGNGHGTHVASIALNSQRPTISDNYNGIAPGANLVSVRAFDSDGSGSYLDVIRGIDWVIANKDAHNIRVMNLSFSAQPQSYYWDDPLNQAVMKAWQAGIVVVVAAGNEGPDPMSIGVPGNVPYVITVGAMSDNYTVAEETDDFLATFSSAGPTVEGFVKPDVVAPGGHMLGLMPTTAQIAQTHPEFHHGNGYFTMSGTSQATAVTSGVVALMLQADPTLTPDDVKCRLMASAHPAVTEANELAYSIFQQGAGLVNAYDAVYSTETDCANGGLNITHDLSGAEHYAGSARQDEEGNYYIPGVDGFIWTGDYALTDGFIWTGASTWTDGFIWTGGFVWTGGFIWTGGFVWTGGFIWTGSETANINKWVPPE